MSKRQTRSSKKAENPEDTAIYYCKTKIDPPGLVKVEINHEIGNVSKLPSFYKERHRLAVENLRNMINMVKVTFDIWGRNFTEKKIRKEL